LRNKAPTSASAADAMTGLSLLQTVWIKPFIGGDQVGALDGLWDLELG
jgi:hypothetical protein